MERLTPHVKITSIVNNDGESLFPWLNFISSGNHDDPFAFDVCGSPIAGQMYPNCLALNEIEPTKIAGNDSTVTELKPTPLHNCLNCPRTT